MQRREENEYPGVLIGGSSQLPTVTQNEENSPSGNPRSTSAVLAGQRVDKPCQNCRDREVTCDRIWPVCGRCKARDDFCDFQNLAPHALTLPIERQDVAESARIISLEKQMSVRSPSASIVSTPTRPVASYNRVIPEAASLAESIRHTFSQGAESVTTLYDFIRERLEISVARSKLGDEVIS